MKLRFVCLVWAWVVLASQAVVLDDFNREAAGIPSSPALTATITSEKALSLAWPEKHGAWIECVYATNIPLPQLMPGSSMMVRMKVKVPQGNVVAIGLRLLDKDHEVFQWIGKVDRTASDWQTVCVPLDLNDLSGGHWGGNNNGRLDFPMRLLGYSFTFANKDVPPGEVLVRDVELVPAIRMSLQTDRFPLLINPAGATRLALAVTNPTLEKVSLTLQGTVKDLEGTAQTLAGQLELAAGRGGSLPLQLNNRRPGVYRLDVTLKGGGQQVSCKTQFAVMEPVVQRYKPGDFLFGICSHPERKPAAEQEMEMQAAAAVGARVLRISPPWASVEPQPNVWKWEVQDRLVDLAAKYGMETQPILGYSVTHAASPELRKKQEDAYKTGNADAWRITFFGKPEDAPWQRYVRNMAERYKGKIRLYEVWNEPDLGFWRGTTDEYINLLRQASEIIRQVDPSAKVLTGGFATVLEHRGRAQNPDLQERVLREATDAFDVHAFHQHGLFDEFTASVDGELARLRKQMPQQRPLYFNETAVSSAYIGERTQAVTLVKKMVFTMMRGAIGYTWYDLVNDGTHPTDMEHNYGLVTSRFEPKASYVAYAELVRRLQGAKYAGELAAEHCYSPLFQTDKGFVVVLWKKHPSDSDVRLAIESNVGKYAVSDFMGCSYTAKESEGSLMIQPQDEPLYVEFAGGTKPRLLSTTGVGSNKANVSKHVTDKDPDGRQPDWTLNQQSQTLSFCGADPALAHLLWKSPADLSAKVWLWAKDETLFVRVVVQDDVHVQKEVPEKLWQGDSVQIAIQTPGDKAFEFGAGIRADGSVMPAVWVVPDGKAFASKDFQVTGKLAKTTAEYEFSIPYKSLGLTQKQFTENLRFNVLVNDNDGDYREGLIRIAPGFGEMTDVKFFPMISLPKPIATGK